MRTLVFTWLLATATLSASLAQTCIGVTFKTGMSVEISQFSAKDKPIGKIMYQVKEVRKEGSTTIMDIAAQFQDNKGNQRPPYSIRYTCTGDELVADMSGLMQSMPSSGMKDMEMKLKTSKLVYPGKFNVEQKLSDGQIKVEMNSNGNTMITLSIIMANRQVESKEPITIPVGTFDTYKISSDVNFENRVTSMPIRSTMRVVSYRTDNQVFDIKSETCNISNKLTGYSLLTKVN